MDDATPTTSTPGAPPASSAHTIHVLVVDDDSAIRAALRTLLEDAKYVVHEAPDGLRAMDMLLASPYPLVVLLDLMMPNMAGSEVLELFANDPQLAGRHVFILVTAAFERGPSAHVQPLLQQLGVPLLHKPFDITRLLELVAAAATRLPQSGGANEQGETA